MKQYISYDKALKSTDWDKLNKLLGKYTGNSWLDSWLVQGELCHYIKGGQIFIEQDSLSKAYNRFVQTATNNQHITEDIRYVSTLVNKKYSSDFVGFGIPIINDIIFDYMLDLKELKASLEKDGIYGILGGTCGMIECCGLFVEVKHIDEDRIAWKAVYYQDESQQYIRGFIVDKKMFEQYLEMPISAELDGGGLQLDKIKNQYQTVLVGLPLYFSKKQLKELLDD